MNDYEKALKFWDDTFASIPVQKTEQKFIDSPIINEIFNEHLNADMTVLDYGTGSGWGLMEMYLTKPFKQGIGIDLSINSIKLANESAKVSGLDQVLQFQVGDQTSLPKETFDFIFSTNTLDVVPDEITHAILEALVASLKPSGYALICLNPQFTPEEMTELLKMENKGHYYYRNEVLRCNYKSIEDWEKLFQQYFTLIKSCSFKLVETEKYERRLYLLKKEK